MTATTECPGDLALDELAAGRDRRAEAHALACAACTARLAAIAEERAVFAREARPLAFAADVLERRPRRLRWPFPTLAAAGLALAAFLLVRPVPEGERAKGAASSIELYVRRDGRTERYASDRRYHAGDTLQLLYSSAMPVHAVVVLGEGARRSVVYRSAAALPPASRHPIDRAFVLDAEPVDERVVLLLSASPVSDATALALVASERPAPGVTRQAFVLRR